MPFGLQIVGRSRDDLGTLVVAAATEAQLAQDPKLTRPRPDMRVLMDPNVTTSAGIIPPALAAR